jgi:hypothetical protein
VNGKRVSDSNTLTPAQVRLLKEAEVESEAECIAGRVETHRKKID